MKEPVYVVDVMREVVVSVSTALTASLQILQPNITGVHYEHGHPIEIIETLGQKDQSNTFRFDRYPLIALFQDFLEEFDQQKGYISEVTLHLIIAKSTDPTYKAAERYTNNFKPFLYPIYREFMKQIERHPTYAGSYQMPHTKTDRLYWGREGLYKNEGNIFSDFLDCIEVKDLKLKLNLFKC